jgi:hypothetical protein
MKRSDYVAPTKRGDENYETIRELAAAEGVIDTDARPAELSYANGTWSIVAGE